MLAWIEASVRYSGGFTKNEKTAYKQKFCLSQPSVSRHQSEFLSIFEDFCNGEVFERDFSGTVKGGKLILKSYAEIPDKFVFNSVPDMEDWLPDVMGKKYVKTPSIRSEPPLWILRILVSSILRKIPVSISYQSRSRVSERVISPLVMVKIAGRHHVRAYDHTVNQARDFVLSRITHIANRNEEKFLSNDPEWNIFTKIVIEEKHNSQENYLGIRADFGLDQNGTREIREREPLVRYLVDEIEEGFEHPVRIRRK